MDEWTIETLRDVLDSGLARPRTARKQYRCRAADPYRPTWLTRRDDGNGQVGTVYAVDQAEAEERAAYWRRQYPAETVTVGQPRNPDYAVRQHGCAGDIMPGDVYVEYLGEAPAYQAGSRYCAACGSVVWARAATELMAALDRRDAIRSAAPVPVDGAYL